MIVKAFEYIDSFLVSCSNANSTNLLSYSLSEKCWILSLFLVNCTWNTIHCLNTYSRWVIIGAWRSISQFWCTWEAPDGRKAKIRQIRKKVPEILLPRSFNERSQRLPTINFSGGALKGLCHNSWVDLMWILRIHCVKSISNRTLRSTCCPCSL